ncbi:MAG: AzlC family ABC transporter permease [Pseudoruegeria sp.]
MWFGILKGSPLAIGVGAYGLAFGVLAAQAGFSDVEVVLMGIFVFAGSSQIVAVERLAADAGFMVVLVTALALNLRYLPILASISPVIKSAPKGSRLLAIHLTADENWALTLAYRSKGGTVGWRFLIGAGLIIMFAWSVASTFGVWLGSGDFDLDRYGIGFAFTAAFIVLARGLWRGGTDLIPWTVAAIVAIGVFLLGLNTAVAILSGGISGSIVGAMMPRPASVAAQ